MALFKCTNCNLKKNIKKQTLIFLENKIRVKESKCKCGKYMIDTTKFAGFGTSFKSETDKQN